MATRRLSPEPREIIGLATIRILVDHEVTVTCTGGGGLPVARDGHGGLRGVEAVIDKDLAAALLAIGLDADGLLLLTDVDGVYDGWGTEEARPLRQTTADRLRSLTLPAGSMGPKVEAVCRFVGAGGRFGAIGALADAAVIAGGDTGTIVHTRR